MQGLLLHAIVHSAGVQDRDGGIWLLATLFGQFPFLAKLFADSAYAGSIFHTALGKVLPNLKTEIVRRSDRAKGFVPLPKRWIVERTIAWLNLSIPAIPISCSRRSQSPIPIDPDQYGAVC
jgi:transposase